MRMLGLRRAIAATSLALYLRYSGDVRRLAVFATVAVIVPPPAGIVTGLLAVGFYEAAKASRRAGRDFLGLAQPEDYDILAEVNRRYCAPHREIIPLPRPEKTVFPALEMR